MKFKCGDRVKCVDSSNIDSERLWHPVKGMIYTIKDIQTGYFILTEDSNRYTWGSIRFELIKDSCKKRNLPDWF